MSSKPLICLLHHPEVDPSPFEAVITGLGCETWTTVREAPLRGLAPRLRETTLVLTLGGDGSFLYGARLAIGPGIPVLGVNLGRLGFLTELHPPELESGLRRFLAGDYRTELRTMLSNRLETRAGGRRSLALNEVIVHRGRSLKLIRFSMSVDGREIGTIDADGAAVATATGSTAYSMALGGPILEPELADLVLVPMNPFALTVRPIVLKPGALIRITLADNPAGVVSDGYLTWSAEPDDMLTVRAHPRRLKVVRFRPPDEFFRLLREKVGWGAPLVPRPEKG